MEQICVLETSNVTGQAVFDLLSASICVPIVSSFPDPFPGLLDSRCPALDPFSDHIMEVSLRLFVSLCMGLVFYFECMWGVLFVRTVLQHNRDLIYTSIS